MQIFSKKMQTLLTSLYNDCSTGNTFVAINSQDSFLENYSNINLIIF